MIEYITIESFGNTCPTNWEECASFLNNYMEDMDKDERDQAWEDFCAQRIPGQPIPNVEEQ